MDALLKLIDLTNDLKLITRSSDGVVSIHINADAWDDFEGQIRASKTFQEACTFPFTRNQGADGRGRRFQINGVEFVDYDRLTGLPRPLRDVVLVKPTAGEVGCE